MLNQQRIIKDILQHYNVDVSYFVALGLLHIVDARNWLICHEYRRLHNHGEHTYIKVKLYLCERYDVSLSTIEKMIYRELKNI